MASAALMVPARQSFSTATKLLRSIGANRKAVAFDSGVLGDCGLIQPYSNSALKRVIKVPRMYFLDTGLCAHLTRWTSAETLERGAMDGAFFETWVVSEIYKNYLNQWKISAAAVFLP